LAVKSTFRPFWCRTAGAILIFDIRHSSFDIHHFKLISPLRPFLKPSHFRSKKAPSTRFGETLFSPIAVNPAKTRKGDRHYIS